MSSFVNLLDIIYPIGSIYQSMNSSSPALTVGGTWAAITTFLYGSTTSGETGGEKEHVLSVSEMPSHNHATTLPYGEYSASTTGHTTYWAGHGSSMVQTQSAGGNAAHNNMPPYTTCYIWQRIA